MFRKLASGTLVDVDEGGRSTFATCSWLVEVPNGNPEPDSRSDMYDIVHCGARLRALTADPEGAWACGAGHSHWPYGTEENRLAEIEAEARDLEDEGYRADANELRMRAR